MLNKRQAIIVSAALTVVLGVAFYLVPYPQGWDVVPRLGLAYMVAVLAAMVLDLLGDLLFEVKRELGF